MLSRYPSAILRHGLDFGGRDTPATTILKPTRAMGNNAGLGPPTGVSSSSTATHLVGVSSVARWGKAVAVEQGYRSRSPRGRPLKGFTSRELRHRLAKQGVEKLCKPSGHHAAGITLVDTADQGEWEFPPARPTAPGRKGYRRGSALRIKNLGSNPKEISVARAEYESDKYARSAVESVKSRLTWWRKRAREHGVEAYPITVERLQLLGTLLKRAGYRSAGAYLSAVKNQHIRLGHPWTNALDLELKEGKRACERGIGPPQKCGAFDMQKLANLTISGDPLCTAGPMWPREGTLCGCWWAMREIELSAARCMQVTFLGGQGCGRCVFDLPVSKTDPQAVGKKRTHMCACSPAVAGSEALCPVKVAKNCTTLRYITDQWGHTLSQG